LEDAYSQPPLLRDSWALSSSLVGSVHHELLVSCQIVVVKGRTSAEWCGFAFVELLKVLPLVESPLRGCAVRDIGIMRVAHLVSCDDESCCNLEEMFERCTK
jgi:hypothetical protein